MLLLFGVDPWAAPRTPSPAQPQECSGYCGSFSKPMMARSELEALIWDEEASTRGGCFLPGTKHNQSHLGMRNSSTPTSAVIQGFPEMHLPQPRQTRTAQDGDSGKAQQLLTICEEDELDEALLEEESWRPGDPPPNWKLTPVGSVPVCPFALTTPNAVTCKGSSDTQPGRALQ